MKLAILGPYPADLDTGKISGGVQAVIVNMVKGLSRFKDLEIHVVTADTDAEEEKEFLADGVSVHIVPFDKRFGNVTLYSNTRKRICEKIQDIKPDIVHSHMFGYYTLAGLDAGHKKMVVSTHGISNSSWYGPSSFIEMIRYFSQDYIYNKCAKSAKWIIVNSPYTKGHLAKFIPSPFSLPKGERVYELNNSVSSPFFDIDNNSEEPGRILFAGYVCDAKGVMTILEAFNILKKRYSYLTLNLAGKISDPSFYKKAIRYLKRNNLTGYVNFLGHLDENNLMHEYRRASVFVFPSKQDVAPVSVLQAMASAKAIVASNVGGIPYIIDDGVNGFLVDKMDSGALAEKVSLFLKDYSLRKRFGLEAREKAFRDYRIEVVTDRLYKIYKEIMAQED